MNYFLARLVVCLVLIGLSMVMQGCTKEPFPFYIPPHGEVTTPPFKLGGSP